MSYQPEIHLPKIVTVKLAQHAKDIAIEFQLWQADQNLSYGEIAYYQNYFLALANKFDLTDEFRENGLI